MKKTTTETIAAIATPPGEGGIGIVRLSGEEALVIAGKIFSPFKGTRLPLCDSHTVHYGCIKAPGSEEIVDEALVTIMRGPRSYTTQDMVEVNCHGGKMPIKRVLELCLQEGARLAEPGEFTKRAFLGGRIDLSQAEAVLDIIEAKTDASCKMAARQLQGALSVSVGDLRERLLDALSEIELGIDFSDQEVDQTKAGDIIKAIEGVRGDLKKLLDTSDKGIILREGASVVICGRPNVGKSSLMNALLKDERVIVTSIAGTTRDIIEESINVRGVMVRLSDTAGIIDTHDRVELEGIKRSLKRLEDADVVIFMLDASQLLTDRDEYIYDEVKDKKTIVVMNKMDLERKLFVEEVAKYLGRDDCLMVSALKKMGLEELEDAIAENLLGGETGMPEGPVITNLRHKECLQKSLGAVERAIDEAEKKYNSELIASDMTEAVHRLGLIIGESVEDDILDRIFSNFCIGK
ncbi:tRNA uridine-5-carboxymethylaminomethyl(34) synthesis GTPase MnmE [Candidatus Omnitrophota bacterium]